MYEFVKISEHDYYIDCPSKIGVVKISDSEVVLIDSGNNKDAAKKVLKILESNSLTLKAVYNTHSHADHIGGNKLLQSRTGCKIYANGIESALTNYPIMEPAILYGTYPIDALKNRFLYAEQSVCEPITEQNLLGGLSLIDLPGHYFGMTGFKTPDGTVFLADSISSKETLQKYAIGYLIDVGKYLETLEMLKGLEANSFVPSHANATDNIKELAQLNIDTVKETANSLLSMLDQPITLENLLSKVLLKYDIPQNEVQYVLIGDTLKSYLTYLLETGKANYRFENGFMVWQKN